MPLGRATFRNLCKRLSKLHYHRLFTLWVPNTFWESIKRANF